MTTVPFVGRKKELQDLEFLLRKKTASLVVIKGRRRIGKSRLIQEFGAKHRFYQFTGLAPNKDSTIQSQLDEFSRQLSIQTGLPEVVVDDWSKLFILLADKIKTGKNIVLFDEISWMGSKDPDFLGKLKNAWDIYFKGNPELILVLCGSVSPWIEKNILNSTGFMGRISLPLNLKELSLHECNQFLNELGSKASPYERLKILAVTGGIPRYLEEIQPSLTAEQNIKRLCFTANGILFREFKDIFSDLFSNRSETYRRIVETLVNGSKEFNDVYHALGVAKSGYISENLNDLIQSGFITRDYTWNLNTGKESRLSHYRLSDNYVRFYLKYIETNRGKIEQGHFDDSSLMNLPSWDSLMALQFENMVLSNRRIICAKLGISPEEIISDNPFFQRKTVRAPGCQIDYLIQTRFNNLYVCEVKFSKHPIGKGITSEVQQKIDNLKRPKSYSCRPVLIHVNGVTDEVLDSGFFSNIIDFSEFLEPS
ncbi:MAG: AAA family ATPase [Alphaproteobacteria bacterium]|nr:AAA family ATPase [Alphaproteobacteria bacterium]